MAGVWRDYAFALGSKGLVQSSLRSPEHRDLVHAADTVAAVGAERKSIRQEPKLRSQSVRASDLASSSVVPGAARQSAMLLGTSASAQHSFLETTPITLQPVAPTRCAQRSCAGLGHFLARLLDAREYGAVLLDDDAQQGSLPHSAGLGRLGPIAVGRAQVGHRIGRCPAPPDRRRDRRASRPRPPARRCRPCVRGSPAGRPRGAGAASQAPACRVHQGTRLGRCGSDGAAAIQQHRPATGRSTAADPPAQTAAPNRSP